MADFRRELQSKHTGDVVLPRALRDDLLLQVPQDAWEVRHVHVLHGIVCLALGAVDVEAHGVVEGAVAARLPDLDILVLGGVLCTAGLSVHVGAEGDSVARRMEARLAPDHDAGSGLDLVFDAGGSVPRDLLVLVGLFLLALAVALLLRILLALVARAAVASVAGRPCRQLRWRPLVLAGPLSRSAAEGPGRERHRHEWERGRRLPRPRTRHGRRLLEAGRQLQHRFLEPEEGRLLDHGVGVHGVRRPAPAAREHLAVRVAVVHLEAQALRTEVASRLAGVGAHLDTSVAKPLGLHALRAVQLDVALAYERQAGGRRLSTPADPPGRPPVHARQRASHQEEPCNDGRHFRWGLSSRAPVQLQHTARVLGISGSEQFDLDPFADHGGLAA
mmetsp:Transcript_81206/g.252031  ORF Transcript_81206/g.252031 Transcript_81206/m.252031 type:complete len:389 (-) Transcript_81206:7-1173(-)